MRMTQQGYAHFAARFGLGMMMVQAVQDYLFRSSKSSGGLMDWMLTYFSRPEPWWTVLIMGIGFVVGVDVILRCMSPVVKRLVDEAVKSPGDPKGWRRLARWHNSVFMPLVGLYFSRATQEQLITPDTISSQGGLSDRQKAQLMTIYQNSIQPCSLNRQWFRTVD